MMYGNNHRETNQVLVLINCFIQLVSLFMWEISFQLVSFTTSFTSTMMVIQLNHLSEG